jgi:hypothetical protein
MPSVLTSGNGLLGRILYPLKLGWKPSGSGWIIFMLTLAITKCSEPIRFSVRYN